jgi:hypothetical protein
MNNHAIQTFALAAALTCTTAACSNKKKASCPKCPPPGAVVTQCDPQSRKRTVAFLKHNHGRYRTAIRKAAGYLEKLNVDPVALLNKGIKGKKKLAEILDAYYSLFRAAAPAEKEKFRTRFKKAARHAYRPEYHDMGTLDETTFKQNSTSYLRVAYLMERMKLDTRAYRKHIQAILGRLNGQMGRRGPHQQMAFHIYYKKFGLKEPFPLDRAFRTGTIASRADPYKMSMMDAYQLTHEVFVVYRYGEKMDAAYFTADDLAYLRRTLSILSIYYIRRRSPDILAELLHCIRMLNLVGMPAYRDGLRFLLDRQQPNGSWGRYRRLRRKYGDLTDVRLVLHTTLVVIEALNSAFHTRPKVAEPKRKTPPRPAAE